MKQCANISDKYKYMKLPGMIVTDGEQKDK